MLQLNTKPSLKSKTAASKKRIRRLDATAISKSIKHIRRTRQKIVVPPVIKKNRDEEYIKWISTSPGFIEGLTKLHDHQTILYPYQCEYMFDSSDFKAINKSRQTGLSFTIAANAFAKAHLLNSYTAIFISINREEASNKIEYARELFDSLPAGIQKKRVTDNKYSLEFETPNGKHRTRLLSLAQRGPRGPGYNTDVFLDEFAHFTWSKEIYAAALPIITRGIGSLTVLSTPFGNKGQFHTIFDDRTQFSEFKLFEIPWWHCPDFCVDVEEATRLAPQMHTKERVARYAKSKLKQIYKSIDIIDFQQEFECMFVDEATAYFPYHLIKRCVFTYEDDDWLKDVDYEVTDKGQYEIEKAYPKINFRHYGTFEELLFAVQRQEISKNLVGGYDIGRKKDSSELCIIEERKVKDKLLRIVRYTEEFNNTPFRKQEKILDDVLSKGLLKSLFIDSTGMGANLAENLEEKHRTVVEGVDFTNPLKAVMAKKVKICLEDQTLGMPDNIDLVKQVHSIRRTITDHSNERFEADKGEKKSKHHADKFWAMALAVHAGSDVANYFEYDDQIFDVGDERLMRPMVDENRAKIMPKGEFDVITGMANDVFDHFVGGKPAIPNDIADLNKDWLR